jgi:hypothetical protein
MPGSWIQDEPEQEVQLKPDISNVRAVETSVIRNTSAAISLWALKKENPPGQLLLTLTP